MTEQEEKEFWEQTRKNEEARQKVVAKLKEINRKRLELEANDLLKKSGFNKDGSEN